MNFIRYLHNNSSIHVQKPIKTKDDKYVCKLPLNAGFATLLSWIDGEPFNQINESAQQHAFQVGELVAQLHEQALKFSYKDRLIRPTYNAERVRNAVHSLEEGIAMGLLTDKMYRELLRGAACICDIMDKENLRDGWYGLIHSDLGLGNIIIHDGIVSPIDFTLCGFGPFLFDIGGLMGTFDHPHLRKAAIDGYSRHRPMNQKDYRTIEAFFLASIYFFMAMHIHNESLHEWFLRRLPLVISGYVTPLIDGTGFLSGLIG